MGGCARGAGQINGNATMRPGKSGVEKEITIEIANATPGGVHPWQLLRDRAGLGGEFDRRARWRQPRAAGGRAGVARAQRAALKIAQSVPVSTQRQRGK